MSQETFAKVFDSGATVSGCGLYRYALWRTWDASLSRAVWIMLNPSTADHEHDDPTVRRCVGFARDWKCGGIVVVNLFALRSTDPRQLLRHADPVGPDNDAALLRHTTAPDVGDVVCGWGTRGNYQWRDRAVLALLREQGVRPECLGVTAGGMPRHPLYVSGNTQLTDLPTAKE